MIQVTSGDRTFSILLCAGGILVVLVNLFLVTSQKTLIALIALLLLLILFLIYNISFIDLWISENRVILRKFNRDINYIKIQKLRVLPVAAKRIRGYSTICVIKYENASGRQSTKLLDVPAEKSLLLEDVKKIIQNPIT